MHFSLLIYFNTHPLHVSNILTIYHLEVLNGICAYGIYQASALISR
jgi:hypothetical protein